MECIVLNNIAVHCHQYAFQPLCYCITVCGEQSTSVPRELGGVSFISSINAGCELFLCSSYQQCGVFCQLSKT